MILAKFVNKPQSHWLSLAYNFQKKFSFSQNLKHVHMTYSLLEILTFFWLALADIKSHYSLEFIPHHIKEIL